jgi:DNA primase
VGIVDEDVKRVRDETDLVALASEHVALKRSGTRYVGLCPFHAEKSPSFGVNQALGFYYCFGCQATGDAITFVREVEHLDFVGAVERLASKLGVTLRYDDASENNERKRHNRLVEVVRAAVELYHRRLLEGKDAGNARGYLRSRGFDGDAVRTFSLGWAPDTFDTVSLELQQRGFARADLLEAGLSFVNKANKLQDVFRSRLLFPIFDVRGEPVGFGGRTLGNDQPKYKNSAENALYHKSRVLYGLNWGRDEIVKTDQVVVCEGYTDVMAFFLSGMGRAVATCGTALADDHFRMLKNFTRNIVLAYDADAAGQKAAEKFYEWESRYEVRLSVAALPVGRDPADVWREDPAALARAVADAKPFLQFRLERMLAEADTVTIEGKARAAQLAVAMISEHPNEIVRDQYVTQTAVRLGLDAARLVEMAARAGSPSAANSGRRPSGSHRSDDDETRSAAVRPRRAAVDPIEVAALRVAIHEPALVSERLHAPLFADPLARSAFDALALAETLHDAIAADMSEDARDLLQRLAVEEPPWGDDPAAYATEVVVALIEAAANRRCEEMVAAGDMRASDVKRLLSDLAAARSAANWATANHSADQLVPWVADPLEV